MNTNTKKVELEIGRIVEVRQCVGYIHILPDGAGLGLSGPNYKTGWLKANLMDVNIENPQSGPARQVRNSHRRFGKQASPQRHREWAEGITP